MGAKIEGDGKPIIRWKEKHRGIRSVTVKVVVHSLLINRMPGCTHCFEVNLTRLPYDNIILVSLNIIIIITVPV